MDCVPYTRNLLAPFRFIKKVSFWKDKSCFYLYRFGLGKKSIRTVTQN